MLHDALNRQAKDLRISVTDRCNFRCIYCMPKDEYHVIDKKEILTFEEITTLARLFIQLGVEKIRLTGGEPLLRRDLEKLVARLSALEGLKDLSLTTNGSFLNEKVPALAAAGLKRINVSLDTLNAEKFERLTRRNDLAKIIEGLLAAKRHGLRPIKINTVVQRGVNEDEILDLVEFGRKHEFPTRFIEYMDVGAAHNWRSDKTVSKKEILEVIGSRFPLREVGRSEGRAPSVDYCFVDGSRDVGVIASVTEPFCSECTRMRLTADGRLVTCLFAEQGHDLKHLIRQGASDDEVGAAIVSIWSSRADRYSEQRYAAMRSAEGYDAADRKKLEMISLGG